MENYVALLLLVVPGFMAYEVYCYLNDNVRPKDKFQYTIIALIYSTFILLFNYLVLGSGMDKFADIQSAFGSIRFVISYILITSVSSIIVAGVFTILKRPMVKLANKIRGFSGKSEIDERPVWSIIFGDGKEHLVQVEVEGHEPVLGGLTYLGGINRKEIYITEIPLFEELRSVAPGKLIVKGVYFDFDSKTKITEFENIRVD